MRVAAETAILGVFCCRWGVPLIDGGTVRLPGIVGQGRANDLILTGRAIGAAEAERIGLVDRVVDTGQALEVALVLAEGLVRFPQLCMRADHVSARMAPRDLAAALRRARGAAGRLTRSEAGSGAEEGGCLPPMEKIRGIFALSPEDILKM